MKKTAAFALRCMAGASSVLALVYVVVLKGTLGDIKASK